MASICTTYFGVTTWYSESLYVLQLTVWEFGIAGSFMYCKLQCGSLV
jgi:hypothetical protein